MLAIDFIVIFHILPQEDFTRHAANRQIFVPTDYPAVVNFVRFLCFRREANPVYAFNRALFALFNLWLTTL